VAKGDARFRCQRNPHGSRRADDADRGGRGLLRMKWFLGALGILLLALLLQAGLLAYAMYVLLGLLLVSRFLAREWIGRLRAERQCRRLTAEIGDTIGVNCTVRNTGPLPIPWVLLEDLLPSAKGQPKALTRVKVKKGKRIQI